MSFIKLGELIEINRVENTDSCVHAVNSQVLENFKKFAINLKKIAPRAEDFLYFSAVMMHAAEASSIADDGSPKLTLTGESVKVGWDKSNDTWRWITNDPNIKPYKNSNGDIFPEEELVKAYRKWVGKPLCIDHKSSSVDHVRGFIVDTYYDRVLKRVIALCALDKVSHPVLARQVTTGVSSCVSMGTAVGKAICSDCAQVARVEADFCDHMRRKTCYGEINVDLTPIELSIVVNGADPKASIKHIIAAANTLNTYVENKSKELNKIAGTIFNATLNIKNNDSDLENKDITFSITTSDLNQFKSEVEEAFNKLKDINSSIKNSKEDTNDLVLNQLSDIEDIDTVGMPNTDISLSPPNARLASSNNEHYSINDLQKITASIEEKLTLMKESLNKLINDNLKLTQEENMSGSKISKGYYQGTEEPTPGKPQYQKDPLNEQVRATDKHMVGQDPYPNVGDVEGLHPSPSSVDISDELERKKMLARAEAEERAAKRATYVNLAKQALDAKAYWQGGGGVNEPTPGKPKYDKDPLNEQIREKGDKHMVGQKPFPNVGDVDGLCPSPDSAGEKDELKRKQLLSRASLRARFVKAANMDGTQNLGKSAWEVYLGDQLLLTASVDAITGGRSDVLYSGIATKEFGASLINKIKAYGADTVRNSLIKSAQDVMPAPVNSVDPAAVAAPAPMAPEAPAVAPDVPAEPVEDTGKTGDPKESVLELAEKARDITSDLVEAVRALTGEQAEMNSSDLLPDMTSSASSTFGTANMQVLRRELNGELISAMKEAVANLKSHQQELEMIAGMYNKTASSANGELFVAIVDDAVTDAKTAIADGFGLMTAFVKYARGTKAMIKKAEIEAELKTLNEFDGDAMLEDTEDSNSELMDIINETNSDLDSVKSLIEEDEDEDSGEDEETDELLSGELDDSEVSSVISKSDENDLMAKPEELKNLQVTPGTKIEVTANLSSLEGRAALRAKLAAEALGKHDLLEQAHRLTDGDLKFDTKPSDNLGYIENINEAHKAILDSMNVSSQVKKEAESIHRLISEGKLDPQDLDALVSQGLDQEAVAYYKKYFGQIEGGSSFANELVKEHAKAELEQELSTFKVKMARAYELTYDMVDRGLVANDRQVISAHVDELMNFNEANFETLKKVVAKHTPVMQKQAGRMPQVGVLDAGETPVAAENDWSALSAAFAKTKRVF
jgi:hypothetical protein